jgi:hypothetical protein
MILPANIKDRYFGVEYYGALQFYDIPAISSIIVINPYYTTMIELRTKAGGIKKYWYYNQDTDNPIETIEIEQTEKGFGVCKITFSDLMFPVDASDIIRIMFGGTPIYEGVVDNDVDVSNPILIASPFWKMYENSLFTGTYAVGTSVLEILEDVIQGLETDTSILWNSSKVDVGGAPPVLTVTYNDSSASDTIDALVTMAGDSYYWGVDSDREFYVKKYATTGNLDHVFYSNDESEFEKIAITEDYARIDMTEAVIYKKKSGGGEAVKVGTVGDAGNITYPPTDISKKLLKKRGKYTANEYFQDTTALLWGYEMLKRQAGDALTMKIDNIDLEKYIPEIGHRVQGEDDFKKTMYVAVDCDSTTNWANTTLSAGQGKDSGNAIKLFTAASDSTYDYGRDVKYYKQEKVGFYIKAPSGTHITVSFFPESSTPVSAVFDFEVADNNVLSYYDFNVTWAFRYIIFDYVAGNVYIDDIQVYGESKKQAIASVKKINIKWDTTGIRCGITCGNIKNPESDTYSRLDRKIKILENINNI